MSQNGMTQKCDWCLLLLLTPVRVLSTTSHKLQGCLEMVTPVLEQGSVTAWGTLSVKFSKP